MKIAIVASEAVPFAKTGGLADVTGALPKALFRLGHEPILILPLHRAVRRSGAALSEAGSIVVPVGKRWLPSRLWRGEVPGIEGAADFLEQDPYFDRDGIYGYNDEDYADNCERFAFLSRGALEAVRCLGFDADVFHLHDWQSALVAPYLRSWYSADPLLRSAAALLTIHNVAYQGIFWRWDMDVLGLDLVALQHPRVRVLGPDQPAQGRDHLRRRCEHGQPDLRARDSDAGAGLGPGRVLRDRATCCTAWSTALTTRSGIPPPTATWQRASDPRNCAARPPARPPCSGNAGCRSARSR